MRILVVNFLVMRAALLCIEIISLFICGTYIHTYLPARACADCKQPV